jgi:hypothetical protein
VPVCRLYSKWWLACKSAPFDRWHRHMPAHVRVRWRASAWAVASAAAVGEEWAESSTPEYAQSVVESQNGSGPVLGADVGPIQSQMWGQSSPIADRESPVLPTALSGQSTGLVLRWRRTRCGRG